MRVGTALRWMVRESRGGRGRLVFFTGCLAVGVAAVVGAAALSEAVREGYRRNSREILGADLTVDARRPLPPELDEVLADFPGTERSDVFETASMVRAADPGAVPRDPAESGDGGTVGRDPTDLGGGRGAASGSRDAAGARASRPARVHAVEGRFPLHGEMVTEPPGGLAAHLAPDTVVVPRELLDELGLAVGEGIVIGGAAFRIAAVVEREPASFGFSSLLGPRLYTSAAGLQRTSLLGFGTRAEYRAYFALPPGATDADMQRLAVRFESIPGAAYLDVDTHTEVGPGRGRTARRVNGFLGLAALLSLVVGGIGVAQIVRAWVAGRTQAVAVLRCLGVRPAEILVISLGNVGLLALIGSAVGVALGLVLPAVAGAFVPDLVPGGLPLVAPVGAMLRGLGLGLGIALIFSLPPLTAIWRVSPALVLRADAAPLPAPRAVLLVSGLALAAGILSAALLQSPRALWAFAFTGGLAVLSLVLHTSARAAIALVRRLPRRRLGRRLAHGLAALARPGAGTVGSVVALGLGTMVVASTWIVQSRLRDGLLAQVPPSAPSVFLLDVQPSQLDGVRGALAEGRAEHVVAVPVVMARIAAVDGRPVEEMTSGDGRMSRRLTREQRLTSRAELPPDNQVVAGALWSDDARAEVSIEERYSRDLGLPLGAVITFDVQGVPLDLVVTSLRRVDWQSMGINFFLVAEPGALEGAPALHLLSARVPSVDEADLEARLGRAFPNVTVLRLGPVLEQIAALVGRIASGIGVLGAFTAAAGLFVLAGAASASALARRREVALLKVLGATRAEVAVLFAIEFGLVGALAGAIGSLGAVALASGFLTYVAELDLGPPLVAVPVSALACAVATAGAGLAASARALRAGPIEVLR